MNILPKKRWHVRTKENIARVRKDQAAAKEQEDIRVKKLKYAESEVRINFLRDKSKTYQAQQPQAEETNNDDEIVANKHVDLFSDFEAHIKTTNKDLENEKKEEREKYEKQIGYLTYLGQDTNEALKVRSWYEVAPQRALVGDKNIMEKDIKNKYNQDPMTLINALLPPDPLEKYDKAPKTTKERRPSPFASSSQAVDIPKQTFTHKLKKHKKEKKHKRDKRKKVKSKKDKSHDKELKKSAELQMQKERLQKLRKERLRREAKERARQEALLTPKDVPATVVATKDSTKAQSAPRIIQKYNSQFNPELAKQNMG